MYSILHISNLIGVLTEPFVHLAILITRDTNMNQPAQTTQPDNAEHKKCCSILRDVTRCYRRNKARHEKKKNEN